VVGGFGGVFLTWRVISSLSCLILMYLDLAVEWFAGDFVAADFVHALLAWDLLM